MPRPRRKTKRRKPTEYTPAHIRHLLSGNDFFGAGFPDNRSMQEGWESLRAEILPEWIREHPGRRPYAWWRFDAPEPRRRIDGRLHPFDDPERQEKIERIAQQPGTAADFAARMTETFFGLPARKYPADFGRYESELDYLRRLGLLAANETADAVSANNNHS